MDGYAAGWRLVWLRRLALTIPSPNPAYSRIVEKTRDRPQSVQPKSAIAPSALRFIRWSLAGRQRPEAILLGLTLVACVACVRPCCCPICSPSESCPAATNGGGACWGLLTQVHRSRYIESCCLSIAMSLSRSGSAPRSGACPRESSPLIPASTAWRIARFPSARAASSDGPGCQPQVVGDEARMSPSQPEPPAVICVTSVEDDRRAGCDLHLAGLLSVPAFAISQCGAAGQANIVVEHGTEFQRTFAALAAPSRRSRHTTRRGWRRG